MEKMKGLMIFAGMIIIFLLSYLLDWSVNIPIGAIALGLGFLLFKMLKK